VSSSLILLVSARGIAHHQWNIRAVDMPYLLRVSTRLQVSNDSDLESVGKCYTN